jgi:hypothetical protein
MAQDRRITMHTSVLATEQSVYPSVPGALEEYDIGRASYNKNVIKSSIGRLGGNSLLTDISASQWGDGWSSSGASFDLEWEDIDGVWNLMGAWENESGSISITTTAYQLLSNGSDLQFCYIKNLGSEGIKISLDGNLTYPLQISSGASTMFRGYSVNLKLNEVYVKTASGTSEIEYLIGS